MRRTSFVALGAMLVLGFICEANADSAPAYSLDWGTFGSGPGEFDDPRGIAASANCDVYVVDSNNNRVQVFDAAGAYLFEWGTFGSGPGEFDHPIGIDVDYLGNVYVVDTGNDRVQAFNSAGAYLFEWGGNGAAPGRFRAPSHVEVRGSSALVTDTGNARVQRFDAGTGTFQAQFGTFGSTPGTFQLPYGIAADPGGLWYITDLMNTDWTQAFTITGTFQFTVGSAGTGPGQFTGPRGLDADSDGRFYVVDAGSSIDRCEKFSPTGTFLTEWGSTGLGSGEFDQPDDVVVCGCFVFVTDRANSRVQRFQNVCLSGVKFDDTDQDGVRDLGEAGLPGWAIELRDNAGALLGSTTTNPSGDYAFVGVDTGTLHLAEVPQPTWYQTMPPFATHTVAVTPGFSGTGLDFGNAQHQCLEPTSLTCPGGMADGFVIGSLETSSPSPAFLAAIASECPGGVTTMYDIEPDYQCFAETHDCWADTCLVISGKLNFRLRAASGQGTSDDRLSLWEDGVLVWSLDVRDLPGTGGTWNAGQTGSFTLDLAALPPDAFGTTNLIAALQDGDLDFLLQDRTAIDYLDLLLETCCPDPASIRGSKFQDDNCNGVWDAGEPFLAGWPIELTLPDGSTLNTVTDPSGNYAFPNLNPGHYWVHEIVNAGWTQTAPVSVLYGYDLLLGQHESGADFGNVRGCVDTLHFAQTYGDFDGFSLPAEISNPGPDLIPILNTCTFGPLFRYDPIPLNQCFGETMTGWSDSCLVIGAELCLRLRAIVDPNSDPETDGIAFYEDGVPVWGMELNHFSPGDSIWSEGEDLYLCLDLAALPASGAGVTNVLAALQDGDLDILVQDDTGVDAIQLDIDYCCGCNQRTCCLPPPPSLCAWYPADAGAPVNDLVAPAATGALIGGAIYAPGYIDDGFKLDGLGDRVDVASHPKLNPFQEFSLDAWIRLGTEDAAGVATIVEKLGTATSGYWLYLDDGFLACRLQDGFVSTTAVSTGLVADNSWHFVALTVRPGIVRMFLDGVKVYEDLSLTFGNFANNKPFRIGGTPTGKDFLGTIDEVEYFRRGLIEGEVSDLYAARALGKCREQIATTRRVHCGGGIGGVSISGTLCNFTADPQVYQWSFAGLPAGGDCDVSGPTSFTPSSGTTTVPAGGCVTISPVFVTCPPGAAGDNACWEFRAWHPGEQGTCDLVANGTIVYVSDDTGWDVTALAPIVGADYSDSLSSDEVTITFRVRNAGNAEERFRYRFSAEHDGSEIDPVLSLDGLPVGEFVFGEKVIPLGQTVPITVKAKFLSCVRRIAHDVVIAIDPGSGLSGSGLSGSGLSGSGLSGPGLSGSGLSGSGLSGSGFNASALSGSMSREWASRASDVFLPVASTSVVPGEVTVLPTSTEDPNADADLTVLRLAPNPSKGRTAIAFQVGRSTVVRLAVHDVQGRVVRLLHEGMVSLGQHVLHWDGSRTDGWPATSGVYFIRMDAGERTVTKKLLVTR